MMIGFSQTIILAYLFSSLFTLPGLIAIRPRQWLEKFLVMPDSIIGTYFSKRIHRQEFASIFRGLIKFWDLLLPEECRKITPGGEKFAELLGNH